MKLIKQHPSQNVYTYKHNSTYYLVHWEMGNYWSIKKYVCLNGFELTDSFIGSEEYYAENEYVKIPKWKYESVDTYLTKDQAVNYFKDEDLPIFTGQQMKDVIRAFCEEFGLEDVLDTGIHHNLMEILFPESQSELNYGSELDGFESDYFPSIEEIEEQIN